MPKPVRLPSRSSTPRPGSPTSPGDSTAARRHLDLIWTLVRTDFKSRYHGTISGFVWALLKPLTMFVSLLAIFAFVFASQPDYRLGLLIGLFLWEFFAEATKVGLISLAQKGYLLSKAKFPAWIVVVTSVANPLLTLFVLAAAVLGYLTVLGRVSGVLQVAWFGLYLLLFVVLVVGISFATSVLFLRYRDLNQIWDVISQAGFFVTPIIWPIGAVPERYHYLLYLWPVTPFVEFARQILLGVPPTPRANGLLLLETGVVFALGFVLFRRLAPRSAEYL